MGVSLWLNMLQDGSRWVPLGQVEVRLAMHRNRAPPDDPASEAVLDKRDPPRPIGDSVALSPRRRSRHAGDCAQSPAPPHPFASHFHIDLHQLTHTFCFSYFNMPRCSLPNWSVSSAAFVYMLARVSQC